jgi:hypothetical protein
MSRQDARHNPIAVAQRRQFRRFSTFLCDNMALLSKNKNKNIFFKNKFKDNLPAHLSVI